jgi:aspartate aminotransferase-like enzyme
MAHLKLHIPGPIEVSPKTYEAMCAPMIGHRSQNFKDLYAKVQPQLQQVFYTKQLVYLSTSSAWGVMEGALRNLVAKKVLCCMNGAFSDKWLDVARRCGKEAEALQVEWGQPILPEQIDAKLATGEFDALTVIHNETSTGTMSPIEDIAKLKGKYPDVMFIVDSVSSCSAVKIDFDALGIDVLLTGSQKAFALPPGLAMFVVSPAALEKSAAMNDRGYYFDFHEFQKNAEKSMTPSTPCISLIYGLSYQLDRFLEEGLENRYARHQKLAEMTREWAKGQGFELFPEPGYESVSLTCINAGAKPGGRVVDTAELQKLVKESGILIDAGYGKLKGQAFRLSNMGDESEESMKTLFAAVDKALAKL